MNSKLLRIRKAASVFGGRRTGSQVEDGLHIVEQMSGDVQPHQQIVAFDIVGELEGDQILPLCVFAEQIGDQNVVSGRVDSVPRSGRFR